MTLRVLFIVLLVTQAGVLSDLVNMYDARSLSISANQWLKLATTTFVLVVLAKCSIEAKSGEGKQHD